ncbi:hypothetical protein BDN72DRAFT_865770 [Pluteus cervinus]|uniref:Uncharacterized protein n=1 Tax=Pluteus cervinus TaxID=181527 RepID=A0ACD2ZZ16_9AGAR|nr:hypothetical protein BDN72DRAFT_865770 [Pluteus cervinus]
MAYRSNRTYYILVTPTSSAWSRTNHPNLPLFPIARSNAVRRPDIDIDTLDSSCGMRIPAGLGDFETTGIRWGAVQLSNASKNMVEGREAGRAKKVRRESDKGRYNVWAMRPIRRHQSKGIAAVWPEWNPGFQWIPTESSCLNASQKWWNKVEYWNKTQSSGFMGGGMRWIPTFQRNAQLDSGSPVESSGLQ